MQDRFSWVSLTILLHLDLEDNLLAFCANLQDLWPL